MHPDNKFHGLFWNALRCRKTGACRILVPLRYPAFLVFLACFFNSVNSWKFFTLKWICSHSPVLQCRFVLELVDPGRNDTDLFFVAPSIYYGDHRTAYGQIFEFALSQTATANQTVSPEGDVFYLWRTRWRPSCCEPTHSTISASEQSNKVPGEILLQNNL